MPPGSIKWRCGFPFSPPKPWLVRVLPRHARFAIRSMPSSRPITKPLTPSSGPSKSYPHSIHELNTPIYANCLINSLTHRGLVADHSLACCLDLAQHVLALGAPDVSLGIFVALSEKGDNRIRQFADRRETLRSDEVGEIAKEALDQIQPRRGSGSKVPVETRMLGQPSFDFGVLVSGVIVGDEMDVESGRRLVIDGLEKGQPLLVAVTLGDAGDQFTVEVVQRGEQGERPVAEVVVGLGLDVADPQGQTRLGALERLALRFLIAAEDQSFLRRIEIEPDHIPELLLKLLVLGQLEGARQMRLDVVGRPQALDGGFRHAGPAGHGPAAPSPQRGGRRHHFVQNHAHRLEWHRGLTPAACGVLQSGQTVGEKPLAPKVDRYPRYADTRGDLVLRHPRRAEDHNLRPLPVAHGHRRRVDPAFQLAALFATQYNLAARHRFPQLLGPQHVQRHHACLSSYFRDTTLAPYPAPMASRADRHPDPWSSD